MIGSQAWRDSEDQIHLLDTLFVQYGILLVINHFVKFYNMSSFQIVFKPILLLAFCSKSYSELQKPKLVSETPSDPLEPIDKWLWTRVGDGGYLYQYPLEFGANKQESKTLRLHIWFYNLH